MRSYTLEVCSGSALDVIQADKGGADRAELCSNLFQGGLTPTIGNLKVAQAETKDIKIMCMVRPREGGFNYTDAEFKVALEDAKELVKNGADGLVCGFLHEDGTVDLERTKKIIEIADGREVCFHRAFDVVPDWKEAMDQLIDLGVDRILTSGQEANVLLALDTVKEMVDYADGRITIMPGAGITPKAAQKVIDYTGAKEMHVYFTENYHDTSTHNQRDIYYGSALYPSEDTYPVIDPEQIARLK